MAIARPRPDPDGITTARLAGTSSRHATRQPLDIVAAVRELQEIADGRGDLLAEQAGLTLGAPSRDERDGIWPQRALAAALLIVAGADLTQLTEWIAEGQLRAERIR